MGRFVTGIVILSFWALGMLGNILAMTLGPARPSHFTPEEQIGILLRAGLISAIIFGIPGGLLVYFGRRDLTREKEILREAWQLQSEEGKIDSQKISARTGLNPLIVREKLARAQRKGKLPAGIEIQA
jgi:hypothetical protein